MSIIRVKKSDVPARRKARKDKMSSIASYKISSKRRGDIPTAIVMKSNRGPSYTYK